MFNRIFSFLAIIVLASLLVVSCSESDLENDSQNLVNTEDTNERIADNTAGVSIVRSYSRNPKKGQCFTFQFPFDIQHPDGEVQTITSEEDLKEVIESYIDKPITEDSEFFSLVFPISVTNSDGNTVEVENEEQLEELLKDCYDEYAEDHHDDYGDYDEEFGFDKLCFSINFPITFVYSDGSTLEINSNDELEELFMNFDGTEFPELAYPISVTLEDSTVVEISTEDEWEDVYESCDFNGGRHNECFTLNFPVNVEFPNGDVTEVNSKEELRRTMKTWFENNQDADDYPEIQYPYSVTLEDGTVQTLTSDDDFESLTESCWD